MFKFKHTRSPGHRHGAAVGLLLLAQDALHQLVGQAVQRIVVGDLRADAG